MLDGIEHIAFYSEVFRDGERRSYLYPACFNVYCHGMTIPRLKMSQLESIISKHISDRTLDPP